MRTPAGIERLSMQSYASSTVGIFFNFAIVNGGSIRCTDTVPRLWRYGDSRRPTRQRPSRSTRRCSRRSLSGRAWLAGERTHRQRSSRCRGSCFDRPRHLSPFFLRAVRGLDPNEGGAVFDGTMVLPHVMLVGDLTHHRLHIVTFDVFNRTLQTAFLAEKFLLFRLHVGAGFHILNQPVMFHGLIVLFESHPHGVAVNLGVP